MMYRRATAAMPAGARRIAALSLAIAVTISAPAQCQDGSEWDVARARLLATAPDSVGGAVAEWQALTSYGTTSASFDTLAGFLLAWPGFPEEPRLRMAAERALTPATDPARVVAYFDRFPPLTNPARARYALSLAALGRPEASAVATAAWRSGGMTDADEAAISARWGAGLTSADQDARLESLLWEGNVAGATRAWPRATPAAQAIANARMALARGIDPEAPPAAPPGAPSYGAMAATPPDAAAPPAPYPPSSEPSYGAPAPPSAYTPQPTYAPQYAPVAVLRADPGYLLERARYLAHLGRVAEAAQMLASHPPLARPTRDTRRWFAVLLAAARQDADDAATVTRLAEVAGDALPQTNGLSNLDFAIRDDATSLYWLGGTAALWRLHDGRRAARLFAAYADAARTPQSRAKGDYWAGRALTEYGSGDGNGGEARRWFAQAAHYPDQFYGLLALERLGQPLPDLRDPPRALPSDAARAAFAARPLARAASFVARDADWSTTVRFFRALANSATTPADAALTADFARSIGRRDLGVITAQAAANAELGDFRDVGFPLIPLPPGNDWTWSHAITRQESQFSQNAVSGAGARGLMQLMVPTAIEQARKMGVSVSASALTADAGLNLMLGSAYFQRLLESFNGSYPLAIASYNAGAGNVRIWLAQNGDPRTGSVDWVEWIEHIPASETRTYVEHVLENAVVYEALYPAHAAYHGPNPLSYYIGKRSPG